MKVSVIVGFQGLLARNLPSRRHANLCWQIMVFDWQEVQTHKSGSTRNSPARALQVAYQTSSGFGRIHLRLRME
jgi:hypothetical protein